MNRTIRQGVRRLVTVASISVLMAGTAMAENLADALTSAYNHSGLLEQNRAVLRAADEDVAIAMSALRPTLSWSAEIQRQFGFNYSASYRGRISNTESTVALIASYTLYDFGKSQLGIEAAKEVVLATRETLVSIEQQVLLRAVSAFLNVRRTLEIVGLRQNNVRVIETELRAARDRFEVGEVTRTDVALAEARLAAARSALAASQGDLDIARAEYTAVVGKKPGNLVAPKSLPRLPAQAEGAATALRLHPDLISVQHQILALELLVSQAEAAMKPTVSLSGRLAATDNFKDPTNSRIGSITLGASGPIYQGGRLSAEVRKARARRDAERGNLHTVRHAITQDVSTAYATLKVAAASIEASNQQVRAATVAFRGVREEASLGARTTFDVLEAEQELLDAQSGLISATIDRHLAAYQVLASLGMLTTEHLKLNVVKYDPAEYYNLVKDAPTARSKQGKQLDRVLERLQKQ
ncbi:TolC family outer membrane protein [Tropicibacter oceani]|uniref:TolC family outer membrane protein n=1 Tax=Tropicibacter oceani TaxID=3058420 RepID=A0ABY8QHS9_9RHOB|nr:TolC family outer membrane protein [Tropicibacter oceani]WGW04211.1 TolC family outer membrane protein [Tropicibacter oceani]